jgi:hypothetical protein
MVAIEKSQEEIKSANKMSLSQSIRFAAAQFSASKISGTLAEAANLGSSPEDTHFSGQFIQEEER